MTTQTQPPVVAEPWLRNRRWASGRIRDESSKFIFFSVLFCLILNTIAWLAMAAAWSDRENEPGLLIFAGILVLLGLAMLVWAVRQIMVRAKFGRSVFELETLPGAIGGWLAGTVHAPVVFDAGKGVHLELECVARISRRDLDGKMSTHEERLLEGKQVLSREIPREGRTTCIPVAFAIPPHARPSGRAGNEEIVWRLRARAAQRGADYDATFIVPLFHVPDAAHTPPQAESIAAPLRKSQKPLAPPEL